MQIFEEPIKAKSNNFDKFIASPENLYGDSASFQLQDLIPRLENLSKFNRDILKAIYNEITDSSGTPFIDYLNFNSKVLEESKKQFSDAISSLINANFVYFPVDDNRKPSFNVLCIRDLIIPSILKYAKSNHISLDKIFSDLDFSDF